MSNKDDDKKWYQKSSTWAMIAGVVVFAAILIGGLMYWHHYSTSRDVEQLDLVLRNYRELKPLFKNYNYALEDLKSKAREFNIRLDTRTLMEYLNDIDSFKVCEYTGYMPYSKELPHWCPSSQK